MLREEVSCDKDSAMTLANPKGSSAVEPFIVVLTWAEMARPLHISVGQPLDDMGQLPQEGV